MLLLKFDSWSDLAEIKDGEGVCRRRVTALIQVSSSPRRGGFELPRASSLKEAVNVFADPALGSFLRRMRRSPVVVCFEGRWRLEYRRFHIISPAGTDSRGCDPWGSAAVQCDRDVSHVTKPA